MDEKNYQTPHHSMKFAWILTCDKKFLPVNSQKSKTSFAGHAHAYLPYLLINLVFHAGIRVNS